MTHSFPLLIFSSIDLNFILSRQKKKKKTFVDWHAWCCLFALLSYLGVTSCKGRVQKQVMGRMNEGRKRRWTPDSLLPFLIKLVTLMFAKEERKKKKKEYGLKYTN